MLKQPPPLERPDADPPLCLDFAGVIHHLPVGRSTLNRLISAGKFPSPDIVLSQKLKFWRRQTVATWIEDQAAMK